MNRLTVIRALLSLCGALACAGISPRNCDADEVPQNIRVEMQVVAVPEHLGLSLVAELKDEHRIEAAYVKIQELLTNGTAKLIGWPITTTVSGQRTTVEGVSELRFASEYDPGGISFTQGIDPKEGVKLIPNVDLSLYGAFPAAFETRNAGVTLEIEPVLSPDNKLISISTVAQHARLKGMNKVTIDTPTGVKTVVEQPEFEMHRVNTSMTLRNGQRILLGVFKTPEPPNHLELFILKAEAAEVK